MNNQEVKIATGNDLEKILPVFKELRPHRNEHELRQLLLTAFQEGYKVAYIGDDKLAFSILGFRIITFIFSGRTLKIDDLATLTGHQKKGYARSLFQWIKLYAKSESCDHINLDSGFHRHEAYKFYLNQGLHVESLHFGRKVIDL